VASNVRRRKVPAARKCKICRDVFIVADDTKPKQTCSLKCRQELALKNCMQTVQNNRDMDLSETEIWNRAACIRANGIGSDKEWW